MQENAARQKEEKAEKEGKPASRPEPPKKTGAAPGGGVPEATVEGPGLRKLPDIPSRTCQAWQS